MEIITSRNNPKIKNVRALRQRKMRRQQGAFLVEGIHHIGEAAQAGATIQGIFYAPAYLDSSYALNLIESQSQKGVPCYPTTPDVFASLAEKEHPQGIIAVVNRPDNELDELSPQNFPWGVALVSPQDPGNFGAILRTIDAVGASGVILLDNNVDPYHPTAVRASMGTLFWYPIVEATFENFVSWAHRHSYHIYGTSAHAEHDYQILDYTTPCILLMGSERQGLSKEQVDSCDDLVRLPMRGHATSLNLAVATGVMLYTMLENLRSTLT